ncbi:MAG: TonB-dependent receptor [Roseateles sp.]|uniref:TonB-dependent receptor n=1 Tax=Roseateles sp. TaxID=1971397 RepID=UPI0039EA5406
MTAAVSHRPVSRLRPRFRATPIASAVGLGLLALAGGAQAQAQAEQQANPAQLDAVVVTGYRSSIEKSLSQKRNADAIVDVITAEDVGKFPDKNVADALQRVPGVIIDRSGGEGKNVSVRGLAAELTLTQLNGNYVATAESNGDPTRSFNYMLMPSNMLSSAELFKTPEARLDEGGVGGTVILRTRRPLDVKSGTGFVSVEGTSADTTGKTDGQFSGQYAWHDESKRLGVLVGYTQQKRTTRTMGASTENWQWYADDYATHPAVDVNGRPSGLTSRWWGQSGFNDQNGKYYTNFMMPTSVNLEVKNEARERKGGQLTVQFKPVDQLTLTGNYFRFDLSQNSQTNMLKVPEWGIARYKPDGNWASGRMLDGLSFDPSGTIVTGANYSIHPGKTYYCSEAQAAAAGLQPGGWGPDDCTIPTPQITGSYNRERSRSQTADFEADWRGETLDVSVKAGRTWAKGGPELQFTMPIKPRMQNTDGSWALGNTASSWSTAGTPTMTFSPELMANLAKGIGEIDLGSTSSSWTKNGTHQNYAQADFTWHVDGSWLDSVLFGVKLRDGGTSRSTGNNYWVCQGADPSDYSKRYQAECNDANRGKLQTGFLYGNSLDHLAGGFNASAFPAIDYPAYIAYLNQTYGAMQTRNEDNFVYHVDEKIRAAYVQANIRTDRLRGNVGLRFVRTKQHADSTDQITTYNDYYYNAPGAAPQPCLKNDPVPAGAPTGTNCGSEGYWRLPDQVGRPESFAVSALDRSYTDVLPSINLAYDLSKNVVLRAAASKVVARPGYNDIAAPGGLQYYSQEYVEDRRLTGGGDQQGWFGSGSNKSLQPYKATQYDLGVEWYFHRGSVLGVNLFRKNVSNFTVPVQLDLPMTVAGNLVTVQNYKTSAGGRNGVSQGIELSAQHTLDFGLGFQFNYTYNKTNQAAITLEDGTALGTSPLVGSAKNQANLTVFYETDQYLLRASYNRRGVVVNGLVNGVNAYQEPYSQIDVNAAYNFSKQLSVTASVLNLTKQESRSHLGNDTKDRFYASGYAGRIAYIGLNYKF